MEIVGNVNTSSWVAPLIIENAHNVQVYMNKGKMLGMSTLPLGLPL
jgi:hypothetical protein